MTQPDVTTHSVEIATHTYWVGRCPTDGIDGDRWRIRRLGEWAVERAVHLLTEGELFEVANTIRHEAIFGIDAELNQAAWEIWVAWARADSVWRPTMAGASWTRLSSVRAATMNRAKSTRRVRLLASMGSPTCRLQTGRP